MNSEIKTSYISTIYAEALFNSVDDKSLILSHLKLVNSFFVSGKVGSIVEDKSLPMEKKFEIFRNIFEGQVQPEVINLICLLSENKKIDLLPQVVNEFELLFLNSQGIKTIDFYTAIEINNEQKKKFTDYLSKLWESKLNIKFHVNPAIIGGSIIKFGDVVYDCSVRKKLNESFEQIAHH